MLKLPIIAIDGPSGVGKSTTAKLVAKRLKWEYLDTGAMYRATALALERFDISLDISLNNNLIIDKFLSELNIKQLGSKCFINSEDVSEAIRSPKITRMASVISADRRLRISLAKKQREICEKGNWVLDGRDIGTVVFPDACCKIYLIAKEEVKAWRRFQELKDNDLTIKLADVILNLKQRDLADKNRFDSPLCKADDAVELDSTNMSLYSVVDWIVARHYSHFHFK